MNFGNPSQFPHWNARKQSVYTKMYAESHRPRRNHGRGKQPSGCLSVILLAVSSGLLALRFLWH